jgi:hypothetical protein
LKNRTAWLVVAALSAAALAAGGVVWATSGSGAADRLGVLAQQNAELSARVESLTAELAAATAAAEGAAPAEVTPAPSTAPAVTGTTPKPKPSFVTYAFVKKVTGPYNETFTVYIDPFEVLTGPAATKYAKTHSQTPPSNGILLINPSAATSAYPLAESATITAYTGGVEAPTPLSIEPGELQSWATNPAAISGASSDMWQVTVTKGVITVIKMFVIAD